MPEVVVEEKKEKKEKRRTPSLTETQKELMRLLLEKHDSGKLRHYLYPSVNFNRAKVWKVYETNGALRCYFYEKTVNSQIRDILKEDDNGWRTVDLNKIRQLPDNSILKKLYLAGAETKAVSAEVSGKSALIDGHYRYTLSRVWDDTKPSIMFIMLNPSTADAKSDDNTIRKCVKFARDWGYGGIWVGNLFAFRATKPEDLWCDEYYKIDKVGEHNDKHLVEMSAKCEKVIFAWGAHGRYQDRNEVVEKMFPNALCLKKTKDGMPQHPLYLKGALIPVDYFTKK